MKKFLVAINNYLALYLDINKQKIVQLPLTVNYTEDNFENFIDEIIEIIEMDIDDLLLSKKQIQKHLPEMVKKYALNKPFLMDGLPYALQYANSKISAIDYFNFRDLNNVDQRIVLSYILAEASRTLL